MNKVKLFFVMTAIAAETAAYAGGILTNTNQNIAFNRNMARDGVIAIDGVYSNPAGVAFMSNGLHLSFNNQSAFQTRTINSSISVPSLQGTPFYQPFRLNGGDDEGYKEFKGEASAPILPSVQAAYVTDRWSLQGSFALVGGGGKCTFNRGLGSFERQISLLPAVLAQTQQTYQQRYGIDLGLGSNTPAYSVESYLHGQQYIFGLQLGATYKLNEHWAVYGGFRFNYIWNKYEGNITKISANINGVNENLYDYLGLKATAMTEQAAAYAQQAAAYKVQADAMRNTDPATAAQLDAAVAQLTQGAQLAAGGAQTMEGVRGQLADRYLDCTQTGWSIDPIIGLDFRWGKLNIGTRTEFTTHFNIQNNTKRDDTGLFTDGVNTPGDMPGITTIGAQYEVLPELRVMAGYHYFWDKNARMDKDKQKHLSGNTQEYNAGVEYDITKNIMVSAGFQKTNYGLGDGTFLSDMSFVTSSHSIGFGGSIRISEKAKLNIAYFWTDYDTFNKNYTQDFSAAGQTIQAECADRFTRTNKVFGVGLDLDL